MLYVETFVEEVFNMNSGFPFSVDGSGVCGDDGHGRSSIFARVCHVVQRKRLGFL